MPASATLTATKTFAVGQTIATRATCNWDTVYVFTVLKRTAKFVTFEDRWGEVKRVGVKVDSEGVEWAMPHGTYSMAAVICATGPTEQDV